MQESPTDVKALVSAVSEEGLQVVMIGGMAVIYYGGPFFTFDVDFAIAFDRDNIARLVKALAPLHPRPLRLAKGANWIWDERSIRPPWSIFQTDAGRLDLVARLPGVDSFEGLYQRAIMTNLWGSPIRVAGIEDLIAMKTASDREKDHRHLQALYELKAIRDEQQI